MRLENCGAEQSGLEVKWKTYLVVHTAVGPCGIRRPSRAVIYWTGHLLVGL